MKLFCVCLFLPLTFMLAHGAPLNSGNENNKKEMETLSQKLAKLRGMLNNLGDRVEQAKSALTGKEQTTKDENQTVNPEKKSENSQAETIPIFPGLTPEEIRDLKEMREQLAEMKAAEDKEADNKDILKNEVTEESKSGDGKSNTDLLARLYEQMRSLQKAIDKEEAKIPSKQYKTVEGGTFGQFKGSVDKRGQASPWDQSPVPGDSLGAVTVGTSFYDPDGSIRRKSLNEIEKRFMDDLRFAKSRGVNMKDIIDDMQHKKEAKKSEDENQLEKLRN